MTNFVLIPGAWLGAWVWKRTIPIIEKHGDHVFPITLTGMGERVHLASRDVGMETAIQDVLNVIKFNDLDDIVMVGHSFAGKVAAAAADRIQSKIRTIIYLDSFWPEKGDRPQGSFDPTLEFGRLPEGSFAVPFKEEILDNIWKDVVGENRKLMMEKCTPWPLKLASDPVMISNSFYELKDGFIFCRLTGDPVDKIIQEKWGSKEGPYKVMETAHYPMITMPEELAENLLLLST